MHKFMKKFINQLASDKIILYGTILCFLILLLSILLVALFYSSLPPYIPLFHQLPWGIERLGNKIEFFLPSSYVLVMSILNLFLAYKIYEKMPLVSRILTITNILLTIILFLFNLRTIQLII
ncbi:hypothetical protein BH11PAT1_BH11PAT1_6900 [soil metagenome]